MTLVFVLGGFFGLLSVAAFGVRKLIDAIKRRRRQRLIERMLSNMPLVDRPAEGPRSPRVLYVPKHEEEPETHEADVVVPTVFIGWDYAKPEGESTEVFVGKGGASGGAGASGDWEAPASETPNPVASEPATLPEPVSVTASVLETSEATIAEPEAPSES
jgi:hypothetical protein